MKWNNKRQKTVTTIHHKHRNNIIAQLTWLLCELWALQKQNAKWGTKEKSRRDKNGNGAGLKFVCVLCEGHTKMLVTSSNFEQHIFFKKRETKIPMLSQHRSICDLAVKIY